MNNSNLNRFLKKKVMLMTFLVVCSIFISEKALAAVWGKECCLVSYIPQASIKAKQNIINIYFKFFEYNLPDGIDNSYIENLEAYYSLDNGKSYNSLMFASTDNQAFKHWSWIELKNKNDETTIKFRYTYYYDTKAHLEKWGKNMNLELRVKNFFPLFINQTWLNMFWHLSEDQNKVTHILIKAKFNAPEMMKKEFVDWVYDITPMKPKMN